jgi:LuxR family quorum sensing-dependent transcriptional regulator
MNAISNPAYSTPLFEPISKIRTMFDAIQVLRKTCLNYGFRYFSVLTIPAMVSESEQLMSQISMISSWPPELIADYDRLDLGRNSPVLERLRNQITPLLFEVDHINSDRRALIQRPPIELFASFGLTMGVYFPVQDGRGQRFAVSFMGDRKPMSAEELPSLAMFATLLIEQISQITASERHGQTGSQCPGNRSVAVDRRGQDERRDCPDHRPFRAHGQSLRDHCHPETWLLEPHPGRGPGHPAGIVSLKQFQEKWEPVFPILRLPLRPGNSGKTAR